MYENCRDIHENEQEMCKYGISLQSFDGEGFSELKSPSLCRFTTGPGQGYSMNHSTYMVTPMAKSFSYSVLEE